MVTSNKDIMKQAREALSGRWDMAVGSFFLYMPIVLALVYGPMQYPLLRLSGGMAILLVGGTFMMGITTFSLAIARKEEANLEMFFSGFNYFVKALVLFLLMLLFVFLWTLLLIIPGIIAAFSYSLVFYIMTDDPNIGAMEAIDKSKKMMYGYKWKFFCLCLRFVGWILLGILTLGIGFLWIIPYLSVCYAKFYEDIKANFVGVQSLPRDKETCDTTGVTVA